MKVLLMVLCALMLTACVNDGNKLEKLRFTSSTDLLNPLAVPIKTFQCFPQPVMLIGEFSDGSLGDFSRRVNTYTSSDVSKLRVSNGDIALPDGSGFYASGVLIPGEVSSGPVTIGVTFAGYTATAQVTVGAPGPVTVRAVSPVSPANPFVAIGSGLGLQATTTFDGQPANVSALGEWVFDPLNDAVATIARFTGAVAGRSAGTLTARYTLPACPAGTAILANANTMVTVAPAERIEVARQFPGAPVLVSTTPLLFGTDAITTTAFFASGEKQDLTFQTTLTLTPTDTTALAIRNVNLLTALQEFNSTVTPPLALAPVTVTSTFNPVGATMLSATTEAIAAKAADLRSVAIPNAQQNQQIPGFGTLQYNAIGSFQDAAGGTFTQDITRHVTWLSSNTAIAFAGNTYGSVVSANGLVTSLKNEAGCVTITADTRLFPVGNTTDTIKAATLLAISPTTQPCVPIPPA